MSDNDTPESETPQTDYHLKMYAKGYYSSPVSIDLAQELERENTQLKRENAALLNAIKDIALLTANGDAERANWVALGILNDPRAAIDAARKEEQP